MFIFSNKMSPRRIGSLTMVLTFKKRTKDYHGRHWTELGECRQAKEALSAGGERCAIGRCETPRSVVLAGKSHT